MNNDTATTATTAVEQDRARTALGALVGLLSEPDADLAVHVQALDGPLGDIVDILTGADTPEPATN